MSLWEELKSRKVVQVAAIYAVVAWLLVQIVATIEEPLSLPPWFDTAVIILLAVGFPLAIILAWAFDLSPQRLPADSNSSDRAVAMSSSRFTQVTQLLVLLAVAFLVADQFFLDRSERTFEDQSAFSGNEIRFAIPAPGPVTDFAISPLGRQIVFTTAAGGNRYLALHALATGQSRRLRGTDGATSPFWSPDGHSVAFQAESELKVLDLETFSIRTITSTAAIGGGGTWNSNGTILIKLSGPSGFLYSVSTIGSTGATQETQAIGGELSERHDFPQFLPDGQRYLFFASGMSEGNGIYVGKLGSPDHIYLLAADAPARYAPSGHLLYFVEGVLYARMFDPASLEFRGEPLIIADGFVEAPAISVSEAGAMAYRTLVQPVGQLIAIDPTTGESEVLGLPFPGTDPDISPITNQILVTRTVNADRDVWLWDFDRQQPPIRFTLESSDENNGIWSPDGRRVVFARFDDAETNYSFYTRNMEEEGSDNLILRDEVRVVPTDWIDPEVSDQQFILYRRSSAERAHDVLALPVDENAEPAGEPIIVAGSAYVERDGEFSPDGRWVAYQSNRAGRFEIWARKFPELGREIRISGEEGGAQIRWAPDGRALYYVALDGRLMKVNVDPRGNELRPSSPLALTETDLLALPGDAWRQQYFVDRDGRILITESEEIDTGLITVILNWQSSN